MPRPSVRRAFVGKRILFATSHNAPPASWRPAFCLTQADDPTGVDLVYVKPLANGMAKLEYRDACRHIDDPNSRDPNFLSNMESDGDGGLWKEDAESLEVARLRDDVNRLLSLLSDQQPKPVANGKKGPGAHWAEKRRQKEAAKVPTPVPVPVEVGEPDLDLVVN